MPAVASPYFDDPSMGQIAQNFYTAIVGDPAKRAQAELYASEVQKNDALTRVANYKADRWGKSNQQFNSLGEINRGYNGTLVPGTRSPYDADPNNITEGDTSTGAYTRPPTANEIATLNARKLQAFAGESNAAELATADRSITAMPFLTSANPNDIYRGSAIMGKAIKDDESPTVGLQAVHAQQASDKGAREAGIKGTYDLAGKRVEAGAEITKANIEAATRKAIETGKPVILGAGQMAVVPKGHPAWTPQNQGVITGLPTKQTVEGAAGVDIAQHGRNSTSDFLYTGNAGGGKGTRLSETELLKGELGALSLIPGATASANGKTVLSNDFITALGSDAREAGRRAYDDSLATTHSPTLAQQAYRDAAGLTGKSYDTGYFGFGAGIKGGAAPAAPQQGPVQGVQVDLSKADGSATGPGGVKIYHVNGQWVDDHGQPVGSTAAQPKAATAGAMVALPSAPPRTPGSSDVVTAPAAQPVETEASSALPSLFGSQIQTAAPPQPATAQVFQPQFASEAEAKKALGGPRDAAARTVLGMDPAQPKAEAVPDFSKLAPSDVNHIANDATQTPAVRAAAQAYQARGGKSAPAAPKQFRQNLPTVITDQKTADMVLRSPEKYKNMVQDAKNFYANRQ